MHIFFIFLASITVGLWIPTFYFLYVEVDQLMHFYFGLISTVSCLLTHTWVFFYFIGTGQGIREGILEYSLDRSPIKITKKFKGKTFPFAFFSMVFMIVAAILGAGTRMQEVSKTTHMAFVYLGIAFNFFTFRQEYRVIQKNRKLMDDLNELIDKSMIA